MALPNSLLARTVTAPRAFDRRAADRVLAAFSAPLDKGAEALVAGVAGCSPYLAKLIERAPEAFLRVLAASPEQSMREASEAAWRAADDPDVQRQMTGLRAAKALAALASALAEIGGAWPTMTAAAHYSRFADAATGAALRMGLRQCARLGFRAIDEAQPEVGSGVVVLAMGKLGAFELNYSSDIDLVVLFDKQSAALGGEDASKRVAVAATKAMVGRLNDQTADGYVFRTDLRLRPDPGVSAAAVSVNAAEAYYESYGQNWERAAFIKARPSAGDLPVGEDFVRRIRPFIWRKFLDFAAIDEIYAVMRQIRAGRETESLDALGRDLKRGVGGIREIEFFAQAQQLIGGGKNPSLRAQPTLEAIAALAEAGAIDAAVASALSERYRHLRRVENRLQMIADEQTHKVPASADEAARLATFLGEPDVEAFSRSLMETFEDVSRLTKSLFEPETEKSAPAPDLVFTGVDHDPQTLLALARKGFERPVQVIDTVRRWQAGETRATRAPKARELLARVTPDLINALARASAPDDAFAAFDGFLRGLPAGVQIFSLFSNRPGVFDRLIQIMTVSPYLGGEAARRPFLLEALIECRWPEPPPTPRQLADKLRTRLSLAEDYEASLNAIRRWKSEESFSVAAQLIVGVIAPEDAGRRFTMIAETTIEALLEAAAQETARQFGDIDGGIAIIALGRLGARCMTAASDVDLMFVYDAAPDARSTKNGALDAVTYFARLVRRLLAAISTPTDEGVVYEVDMQLRPSGAKGPAAVSLAAFRNYYEESAWTWERMALTKARVIAGAPEVCARVRDEIERIFRQPRDRLATARDVDDMREQLFAAKPAISPWDVKNARGGATEIDFVVQFLTLTAAARPGAGFEADAFSAFARAGEIDLAGARTLAEAQAKFEAIAQLSRAATGGVFSPGGAGRAFRRMMARLFEVDSIEAAEAALARLENRVRNVYVDVVARQAHRSEVGVTT